MKWNLNFDGEFWRGAGAIFLFCVVFAVVYLQPWHNGQLFHISKTVVHAPDADQSKSDKHKTDKPPEMGDMYGFGGGASGAAENSGTSGSPSASGGGDGSGGGGGASAGQSGAAQALRQVLQDYQRQNDPHHTATITLSSEGHIHRDSKTAATMFDGLSAAAVKGGTILSGSPSAH